MEYLGFFNRGENLEWDMQREIGKYQGSYVAIIVKETSNPIRGLVQRINSTNAVIRIDRSLEGEPNAQNSVLIALDQISVIGPGIIIH